MEWLLPFGSLQWLLVSALGLAFAAYLLRSYIVAKRLGKQIKNWYVKLVIRIVYLFLLFVALQGPLIGKEKQQAFGSAKEIWLVFDVSASMGVADVVPTRLERAKQYAKLLIERFKGERIGLIVFAGESFVHCPLTVDDEALLLFLQAINPAMVEAQGSNINHLGMLLKTKQEENAEEERLVQAAKTSVIFSDGEFHNDPPLEPEDWQWLKRGGNKVFCIALGTSEGGKVPKVKGKDGEQPISSLNLSELNEIAKLTDGNVFEVSSPKDNPLPSLIKGIERLKGINRLPDSLEMAANKYQYALGIALIFIVIDVIFTVSIIKLR